MIALGPVVVFRDKLGIAEDPGLNGGVCACAFCGPARFTSPIIRTIIIAGKTMGMNPNLFFTSNPLRDSGYRFVERRLTSDGRLSSHSAARGSEARGRFA